MEARRVEAAWGFDQRQPAPQGTLKKNQETARAARTHQRGATRGQQISARLLLGEPKTVGDIRHVRECRCIPVLAQLLLRTFVKEIWLQFVTRPQDYATPMFRIEGLGQAYLFGRKCLGFGKQYESLSQISRNCIAELAKLPDVLLVDRPPRFGFSKEQLYWGL